MAKPDESDLFLLRNHVAMAPRIYLHAPGGGDPAPTNNVELKISLEQRNWIVRALDCLKDVNFK